MICNMKMMNVYMPLEKRNTNDDIKKNITSRKNECENIVLYNEKNNR